jgi:hypothetical protein
MAQYWPGQERQPNRSDHMRLFAFAAAAMLTLAPAAAFAQDSDFSGDWTTNYGGMHLQQYNDRVYGRYEVNDGRIRGHVEDRTLVGLWSESSSGQYCNEERMGTHYWGRVRLRMDREGQEFHGHWGYCDGELTSDWDGHR